MNVVTDADETPLHWAVRVKNNFPIIKELIHHGADPNAVGKHGLALTIYKDCDNEPQVVQLLEGEDGTRFEVDKDRIHAKEEAAPGSSQEKLDGPFGFEQPHHHEDQPTTAYGQLPRVDQQHQCPLHSTRACRPGRRGDPSREKENHNASGGTKGGDTFIESPLSQDFQQAQFRIMLDNRVDFIVK